MIIPRPIRIQTDAERRLSARLLLRLLAVESGTPEMRDLHERLERLGIRAWEPQTKEETTWT